jgi:hypothetical protein
MARAGGINAPGTASKPFASSYVYFNDWYFCHKFATLKCGNVVALNYLR